MMDDVSNKQARASDVTNGPYDVILQNVDLYSGLPIGGAAFELSYDWMPDGPMAITCNKEGRAEFTFEDTRQCTLKQTKAPSGYQLNSTPIVINVTTSSFEIVGDQESDWYDYDNSTSTLTVKNAPIQSQPEGGTKMKVATDNSLKELIKLVKSQPSTSSGGILNVTLDYTIPSYSQVEVETKRKRVYADVPCVNSKVAMNAQITPNDNIENVSLLTYAEPFDGYIRCYFSEQPTESYIIDSVELTPVTSIVKKK